jgi:hypothetical protein
MPTQPPLKKPASFLKKILWYPVGIMGYFLIKKLTAVSAPWKAPVLGLYPTQSAANYNNTSPYVCVWTCM